MSKVKERIIYWSQILLMPIYGLSFFMPRNKKIWLFGSTFGKRFADNPRYAFLYVSQYHKEICAVWISHNKEVVERLTKAGYKAYLYHSVKGIYYALRGGVYIYDNYSKDINFWQSGGAVKVNLWHGTATKKIQNDNLFDYVRNPRTKWEAFQGIPRRLSDEKPNDYILATSKNMAPIMAGAFRTKPGHTIACGHPRNDVLLGNEICDVLSAEEIATQQHLEQLKADGKTLLYYVPTFRESEKKFFEVMDIEKFDAFLGDRGYVLCTKLHIKSKLKKQFEDLKYQNIYPIDADVDPATILHYCDLMIADYSSIYLDYMFLDRPAVAFPFDYEEYTSQSREMYFSYEDYMPERMAHNMEELMNLIDEIMEDDRRIEQRRKRRAYHFDDIDCHASERLYQAIKKITEKK